MIPFIDITLVLLIIVMVMTPFLVKEQIKINLPSTKSVHSPVDSNSLLQIDVTDDGSILVDGNRVTADNLEDEIRRRLTDAENQPVVIAADRDVPFEKVVVAMDAAKSCGAKRLGVSVKHEAGAHVSVPAARLSGPKPVNVTTKRSTAKPGSDKRRTASSVSKSPKSPTSRSVTSERSRPSKR